MLRLVNTLSQVVLRQRKWVIACLQAFLIFFALLTSWLLRFDFSWRDAQLLWRIAPILVAIRLLVIARFRLMHGWWRYTGVSDAVDILKATALGSTLIVIVVRYILNVRSFPISVYAIEPLLSASFLMGVRLGSRVLAQSVIEDQQAKRLLLIGAGHASQMVIREVQQVSTGYVVVGCLDDDPQKQRLKLQGVKVLGKVDQAESIARKVQADELLIAVPSATADQLRRFVKCCEGTGKPFRMVPGIGELVAGRTAVAQIRRVELEDLLSREPVKVNLEALASRIEKKTIMVTGAAGSIGSELCRQLLRYRPGLLICVDQNETGLFYLEQELRNRRTYSSLFFNVANVCDIDRMTSLFANNQIDIVYHAAAYKHVPLMESNVYEAVNNNIFGLLSLLAVADMHGCESFLMISSDKAVNPTNVMGATKRICELILASRPTKRMRCVSVRFGNVLGSQGSVVPVFQRQIIQEKRITVTHPEITRFFMTIGEAVSLVLQAEIIGKHRDILVLDMGGPVKIVDLARTLIRLSGRSEQDIEIVYTGIRPGEKLFEELFYSSEHAFNTRCEKIKRTQSKTVDWATLKSQLDLLSASLPASADSDIRSMIAEIVPQYSFAREAGVVRSQITPIAHSDLEPSAIASGKGNIPTANYSGELNAGSRQVLAD